jgi:small subunit ribosomal protein S4
LTPKCSFERRSYPPGEHGRDSQFRRGRASDYLLQLREKQKARRIYGVYERQFSRYFKSAVRQVGLTGTNLLVLLESRLDNVVYRMGMATSRSHARQLVAHGHVMVNGRKTKAPSALVTPGDVISIRPESMGRSYFKTLRQDIDDRQVPRWISLDTANMTGKVLNLPVRDDIDVTINEQLVVEYYSRR